MQEQVEAGGLFQLFDSILRIGQGLAGNDRAVIGEEHGMVAAGLGLDRQSQLLVAGRVIGNERQAADVPGRPSLALAPSPASSVVEAAVSWATSDLWGPVTPDATTAAADRLAEAVSQLVLDQGRQTIIGAVKRDKYAKGWARVTEPGACAFCTMLALRAGAGMLYYKRSSADFQAPTTLPTSPPRRRTSSIRVGSSMSYSNDDRRLDADPTVQPAQLARPAHGRESARADGSE